MLQYIVKRIVMMIPTLLGISLVTLLLVHLAPGDPVQAQFGGAMSTGQITAAEIESLRRTYFLHLPLFINPSPEDADDVNRHVIEQFHSREERERDGAIRRLSRRGVIVLPEAVEALEDPEVRAHVLTGLKRLAARMGIAEELSAAADASAFWKDYLEAHRGEFTESAVEDAVAALIRGDKGAMARIHRLDTVALDELFRALSRLPKGDAPSRRIMDAISHITGVDITIRPGESQEGIARAYDDWERWWYTRKADYQHFRGFRLATAIVTETQYYRWVVRLLTLDFDRSSKDNVPVREKLKKRLGVTVTLAMLSLIIAYLVAVPIGVYSAIRQYTMVDQFITLLLFILYSLPSFWVAMLLQQYLCGVDPAGWDIFPLVGLESEGAEALGPLDRLLDWIRHLVLPVFCLSYASFASLSRYQRVGMLDTIRQDYIRTARAKGLSERTVILKHALRNSVIPIITLIGLQLPYLVGGAVIVELIFQINGMGLETFEAIRTRDLNWIMASVSLTAVMTMVGLLVSDILYAIVDPRISVGEGGTNA